MRFAILTLFAAAALAAAEPTSAEGLSRMGDAYLQKGRETADAAYAGQAESAYRKALDANPRHAESLIGMALVAGVRHEYEASIEWARKALAADPASSLAYGPIGDAEVAMGEYDKAFEHYQKMLDARQDIGSLGRSAHLVFLMGDTRKAYWLTAKAIVAGAQYRENVAWCHAQLSSMRFTVSGIESMRCSALMEVKAHLSSTSKKPVSKMPVTLKRL